MRTCDTRVRRGPTTVWFFPCVSPPLALDRRYGVCGGAPFRPPYPKTPRALPADLRADVRTPFFTLLFLLERKKRNTACRCRWVLPCRMCWPDRLSEDPFFSCAILLVGYRPHLDSRATNSLYCLSLLNPELSGGVEKGEAKGCAPARLCSLSPSPEWRWATFQRGKRTTYDVIGYIVSCSRRPWRRERTERDAQQSKKKKRNRKERSKCADIKKREVANGRRKSGWRR